MDNLYAVLRFFQSGGVFMYPIVLVLALGIAIIIERYIYLTVVAVRSRKVWQRVLPLLEEGRYENAWELTLRSDSAMSRILAYGLQRAKGDGSAGEVQMAMEEGMLEYIPRLEKRTHYLATFANIATLLGLLGTIMGLTEAFSVLADIDPANRADLLSASISVAMNTTAFGLMVAIPLLLAHAYMQTKTNQLLDSLEMAVVKVSNLVHSGGAGTDEPK
ncbi:MotA/TolQ/ExbB proton channel family protein [Motiliproteus coralliicola]|uniref:MotA/TolQ/ExbB proton channel family protein n=1 Tax=Motiliproteus coralliicola TaxID=2283196 RepID=A0A369WLI5_9GAMM|nr:MotA/TolQ/ExbB proton channel family protein [Motiliproteus coralliicola]RDE22940.1 MotA/TolQ/ExbB proton channel family protein [Motiliproteus coralliicola]